MERGRNWDDGFVIMSSRLPYVALNSEGDSVKERRAGSLPENVPAHLPPRPCWRPPSPPSAQMQAITDTQAMKMERRDDGSRDTVIL